MLLSLHVSPYPAPSPPPHSSFLSFTSWLQVVSGIKAFYAWGATSAQWCFFSVYCPGLKRHMNIGGEEATKAGARAEAQINECLQIFMHPQNDAHEGKISIVSRAFPLITKLCEPPSHCWGTTLMGKTIIQRIYSKAWKMQSLQHCLKKWVASFFKATELGVKVLKAELHTPCKGKCTSPGTPLLLPDTLPSSHRQEGIHITRIELPVSLSHHLI